MFIGPWELIVLAILSVPVIGAILALLVVLAIRKDRE